MHALLLQSLINSSNPRTAEAGLLILADLAGYSTDHLRPHLAGLHPLLAGGLAADDVDVQVRGEGYRGHPPQGGKACG
jgi:hypothetical protein